MNFSRKSFKSKTKRKCFKTDSEDKEKTACFRSTKFSPGHGAIENQKRIFGSKETPREQRIATTLFQGTR